jgi:hypothetical protein
MIEQMSELARGLAPQLYKWRKRVRGIWRRIFLGRKFKTHSQEMEKDIRRYINHYRLMCKFLNHK